MHLNFSDTNIFFLFLETGKRDSAAASDEGREHIGDERDIYFSAGGGGYQDQEAE